MKVLIPVIVLFSTLQSGATPISSGFCAVQSDGETLCTPIFPILDQATLNLVCDSFAQALEADGFDSFLNPDLEALAIKHKEVCEGP